MRAAILCVCVLPAFAWAEEVRCPSHQVVVGLSETGRPVCRALLDVLREAQLAQGGAESGVPADGTLADGIHRVGDVVTITPMVRDVLLRAPMAMLRPGYFKSYARDGVIGQQLRTVRYESPVMKMGLQNGDVVVAVNGVKLETAKAAESVWAEIQKTPPARLELEVAYRGVHRTVTIRVKP